MRSSWSGDGPRTIRSFGWVIPTVDRPLVDVQGGARAPPPTRSGEHTKNGTPLRDQRVGRRERDLLGAI